MKISELREVAREITKVSEFKAKNMIFHDLEREWKHSGSRQREKL